MSEPVTDRNGGEIGRFGRFSKWCRQSAPNRYRMLLFVDALGKKIIRKFPLICPQEPDLLRD